MVVVISLPFIIFCLVLGFGCYFFGRARGRREVQTNPQVYGMPSPPPGAVASNTFFPSPPAPHSHSKPDNTDNVWSQIIYSASLRCCVAQIHIRHIYWVSFGVIIHSNKINLYLLFVCYLLPLVSRLKVQSTFILFYCLNSILLKLCL